MKRNPYLTGCKNEYKLSNHSLNTQIVWHVEKVRVFFYRVKWPWAWHNDVIFRVIGLQKFETDQNNAKFSQITWPLHP